MASSQAPSSGNALGRHPPASLLMEVAMLTVFLACGYLVRQLIVYQPASLFVFGGGLITATMTVEGVHEGLHKLVFEVYGVSADIEWTELATIPHDQEVPVKFVLAALVTPGIVLSGLLAVGAFASDAPAISALLGYGLVLNLTLSVVDVFSFATVVREPLNSRIYFESTTGGTRIHAVPASGNLV